MRRWSKQHIADEVRRLSAEGADLNYAEVASAHMSLMRAALRHFGSWQAAVEHAGLPYVQVRKYRTWTRESIVEQIRELHAAGEDLSWRHISTEVDPQLGAAATKRNHFGSWRAAVEAAGIDYNTVRRYRTWTVEAIVARIRELREQGVDLNARSVEEADITLITAARRRLGSWDAALTAAGLDYRSIVLRAPFRRKRKCQADGCGAASEAKAEAESSADPESAGR